MQFPAPTDKQARIIWMCVTFLLLGLALTVLGLVIWSMGWLLTTLSSVLLPLAIAAVIAYLFDPVVDLLQARGIPRVRGILLVFFVTFMGMAILMATVVPRLVVETNGLVQDLAFLGKKFRIEQQYLGLKDAPKWMPPKTAPTEGTETQKVESAVVPGPIFTNLIHGSSVPDEVLMSTNSVTLSPADRKSPTKGLISMILTPDVKEALLGWAAESMPKVATWLLNQLNKLVSWTGFVIGLALVPVYVFYFLLEKSGIQTNWQDYLPLRHSWARDELAFVLGEINERMIVFFRSQVLVALCVGALLTVGYLMMGLHYALILGVMAGILGIVPYLGIMLSILPALTLSVVQFGDALHPGLVLAWFIVVQLLESLFISPKIIGDRVGLHPLTVIIAIMIGTTLMGGVLGGLIAIPLTATLRTLMFRYVWKLEVENAESTQALAEPEAAAEPEPPSEREVSVVPKLEPAKESQEKEPKAGQAKETSTPRKRSTPKARPVRKASSRRKSKD